MKTPLARVIALTSLAMIAFAGNSLLCRIALTQTNIDAATFTTIRLMSGAVVLWVVVRMRRDTPAGAGNWVSAFALFTYAAGLSFAYVRLPAATGALLLFGAVQATMIGYGVYTGERPGKFQIVGLILAIGGLVGLLLPGLSAPPLYGSVLMLSAGVAWGITGRTLLPWHDAPWVDEWRRTLEEVNLRALECLAAASIGIGGSELDHGVRLAREGVARAPLRERFHVLLMEGLVAAGSAPEALAVYEGLRRGLRDELGVAPGPEARALHARILGATGTTGHRSGPG